MKLGYPPCTFFHRIVNRAASGKPGSRVSNLALGGGLFRTDDDRVLQPSERVTVPEHMTCVILEEGPVRHPYPVPERVLRRRHEDFRGLDDTRIVTKGKTQDPAAHIEGKL